MARLLSVYDITIQGVSQGVNFQRQGKIYIYSTVTSVTENGVNPLDVFIESGFPVGNPTPGSIWLSTNNALFPDAGIAAVDMAYVSTSANQINIQPDSGISAVQGNNFTVSSGLFATPYLIVGGTATLQFQNNQQNIVGNINIIGKGYSFSTNTPYQATISGTLSQGTSPLSQTGDFNKDGNTDILMSNASQGWSGFYTMNGTTANGWVGLPYSSGAVATGAGDFNKDGNTDILMSNASQDWSGFYTMNGTTTSNWVSLPYSSGAVATGAGDFNKDGNTDILMSNASQGWSGFYTMNGTTANGWVSLPYSSGAVAM